MATGERIALLIGVGTYAPENSHSLKPLHSPPNNVAELQKVLENAQIGGFQVMPLIDPQPQAMRDAIEWLFANRRKSDLVLLYFTGHGVKDDRNELYLTTAQTQLYSDGSLKRSTAVEAAFVRNMMASSLAQQQVVILDCCFSGAFPDGVLAMDDGAVNVQQQLGGEGRAVMTAATSTQYALEQEGEPLSVYTRYLVEGLATGAAAPDNRDKILVGDLHDYVRAKVREAAPAMKPELNAAKESRKIWLAQVLIGDPEVKFRQEVERRVHEGKISRSGQRLLERRGLELKITSERAAEIIQAVLRPYEEKRANLKEYWEMFQIEVEAEYPLPDFVRRDLQDLQQELGLRDEDVEPIESEILASLNVNQSPSPTVGVDPVSTLVSTPVSTPKSQQFSVWKFSWCWAGCLALALAA